MTKDGQSLGLLLSCVVPVQTSTKFSKKKTLTYTCFGVYPTFLNTISFRIYLTITIQTNTKELYSSILATVLSLLWNYDSLSLLFAFIYLCSRKKRYPIFTKDEKVFLTDSTFLVDTIEWCKSTIGQYHIVQAYTVDTSCFIDNNWDMGSEQQLVLFREERCSYENGGLARELQISCR